MEEGDWMGWVETKAAKGLKHCKDRVSDGDEKMETVKREGEREEGKRRMKGRAGDRQARGDGIRD